MIGGGDIFVVDDNPHNLTLLTTILRQAGHTVRMTNTGRGALAAIRLKAPELIMLDINMPEMNGYQVCAELKADPRTQPIPVIFLSALDDVRDKVSAFAAGGADYVTKPFQSEEVIARVDCQLRVTRLRVALEEKNRELAEKNEELRQAWRSTEAVFSTLTNVLDGVVVDDKYRLEAKIAMGGFAAIYRAHHLELDRRIAVKVLRPIPGFEAAQQLERFRLEGTSLMRLNHPNVVTVFDSGVTNTGIAYIAMELLEGRTLAAEIEAVGPMPLPRCAEILLPVCAVLAEAHSHGIIHRDVKPSNIFLHCAPEGGETVKVVDFGIAKVFDQGTHTYEGTTIGKLIGTPIYMSPERLLGKPHDTSADTYSVGMTLYEMIAGRLPFAAPTGGLGETILMCVSQEPMPLGEARPGVPCDVETVVMRALSKRPEFRPGIRELARDFLAALEG